MSRVVLVGRPSGKTWTFALLAIALGGLAGCSSEPATEAAPSSEGVPATSQIDHEHPVVRINTSAGAIVVRLDAVNAPGTVRSFLDYMNEGFYSNTLVHYVAPGKMILAGGYTADGQLKPTRPSIRNEAHNGLKNVRGTIASARDPNAGIDSATSQFFINLADSPSLDHRGETPDEYGYCVFGEVIEGLDVAEHIAGSATSDLGGDLVQSPDPPVVVTSVEFVRQG